MWLGCIFGKEFLVEERMDYTDYSQNLMWLGCIFGKEFLVEERMDYTDYS